MSVTSKLLLQFGDGGAPETFAANCSINTTREFTVSATTNDFVVPNCDDPEAVLWQGRTIDVLSAGINGAGTMDPVSWGFLRQKMLAGDPVNVRVKIDLSGAAGGGYFLGPYVLTTLTAAKETNKGMVNSTVALQSAGDIVWVDAA